MRLYRGLKNPCHPERAAPSRFAGGTDFTDCPAIALRYAQSLRGVVLVVDLDPPRRASPVGQADPGAWLVPDAKRFMPWGRFDPFLIAVIPAKDLRAQLRLRGVRSSSDETKSIILQAFIARDFERWGAGGDGELRTRRSPASGDAA